jgi:hypothetical protein
MKVRELIKLLQSLPEDVEVFYRSHHQTGNIKSVDRIEEDTYGFFGKNIPCVILDQECENEDD